MEAQNGKEQKVIVGHTWETLEGAGRRRKRIQQQVPKKNQVHEIGIEIRDEKN